MAGNFQPILTRSILTRPRLDFEPFLAVFQGFWHGSPLKIVVNHGQAWIPHPQNRGIPCRQPLEPLGHTFIGPNACGWGPQERVCAHSAYAMHTHSILASQCYVPKTENEAHLWQRFLEFAPAQEHTYGPRGLR